MRFLTTLVLLALVPYAAHAQSAEPPRPSMTGQQAWRATLTIFRSPGTGVQLSKGYLAVFLGHYPTVIKRDGEQRATQFVRMGVAYYVAPHAATSPYASLSFAPSLTRGWSNSGIADVGVRRMVTRRFSGQLGIAVLHAPGSHETRVSPTIGLGVRF